MRAWVCSAPICDWTPEAMLPSCDTFTASVGAIPAATLVSRRSLPAAPNDTVLGAVATEPWPIATELLALDATTAPSPIAVEPAPAATLAWPIATEFAADELAPLPIATLPAAPTCAPAP